MPNELTNCRPRVWLFYWLLANLLVTPLLYGGDRAQYWGPVEVSWHLLTATCLVLSMRGYRFWLAPLSRVHCGVFVVLFTVIGFQLGACATYDPHNTWSQMNRTLCLAEVFFLSMVLIDSRSRLSTLANSLVLAGLFQAVYGTLMTVTGTDYIWNTPKTAYIGVATGTYVNRNDLAGYLEMTIPLGLGLLIANLHEGPAHTWREWLRRWAATLLGPKARIRIFLVLMVIGLILTRSRMGNTAFFTSMLISGGIGLLVFRRAGRGVILLFASMIIIDILLMGSFFGLDALQKRLEQTNLEQEQRILVNKLSLPIVADHPIIGTGLGSWYTVFPQYRNDEVVGFYLHAHSDMIEFPSDLGFVGFLPLVVLVLHSLYTAIRVQIVRRSRLMRAMGFSSTMAIIAIMMHETVDFNLQLFANAATFMVILALPYVAMNLERGQRKVATRRGEVASW